MKVSVGSDDDWEPGNDSDSYSSCDSCDDDDIFVFTGWSDEDIPDPSAKEPEE